MAVIEERGEINERDVESDLSGFSCLLPNCIFGTHGRTSMIPRQSPEFAMQCAIFDPQDDDLRSKKWYLNQGYLRGKLNKKTVYAHKIVAERMGIIGIVDHANGNRLDNRRENLRTATRAQNNRNQVGHRDRVHSKYKGVTRGRRRGWAAQISKDGKTVGLGTYETEKEAANAYDMAARFLFGEFARCNFEGTDVMSPRSILESLMNKRSKYGIPGIYLIKSTGRYRVYKTGIGKANQHVGVFKTIEEAIYAAKSQ